MARLARDGGPRGDEARARHAGRASTIANLWRYTKCFIGGSVSAEANGVVDCVEGAAVRLLRNGAAVATATTDNYGDFKFDKLDEGSGRYTVEISGLGRKKSVEANLGASVNLGEIRL